MGRIERLENTLACSGPDREIAQLYGFSAWHLTGLRHYCRDNQALLVLRASKSASRRFRNLAGYRPKPVNLKQKTFRGWAEGASKVYPNVNKFYSDYDIMGLWHRDDAGNDDRRRKDGIGARYVYAVPSLVENRDQGVPVPVRWQGDVAYNTLNCPIGFRASREAAVQWYGWECAEGYAVLDELNEYLGDSTMFQHGANDQYRNWRTNAMENEIAFDEKFVIVDRKMDFVVCRNARVLKAYYDANSLEWPPYAVHV
ncbi:hypothetical protein [Noviherbaspirillum sp.]|uniref:hypothetical protein n=1 Tax=Noviherbaspirillum sp. TaxID=1926288 RepID=UPI002FE0557E